MILSEPSALDAEIAESLDRHDELVLAAAEQIDYPIDPAAVLVDLRAAVAAGDLDRARALNDTLVENMNYHAEKIERLEAVADALDEKAALPAGAIH